MHLYERMLLVPVEDVAFAADFLPDDAWTAFLLNPRLLRGSDFLMRWSQGVWSERRLVEALDAAGGFFALPYGPSGVAPDDPRGVELYFERLEAAGLDDHKRPDLLVFRDADRAFVDDAVAAVGGPAELPFTPDRDPRMARLLSRALIAIECENSLWRADRMPHFTTPMRPMARLGGKPGLKKSAVLPTIIVKDEDLARLDAWQSAHRIPIHIWHVFYDRAYGIALDSAKRLFAEGLIEPTIQTFQAPGGAVTRKAIYKIYYHYGYPLGQATAAPALRAAAIEDTNGHILPYVTFEGGTLVLNDEAKAVLEELAL